MPYKKVSMFLREIRAGWQATAPAGEGRKIHCLGHFILGFLPKACRSDGVYIYKYLYGKKREFRVERD